MGSKGAESWRQQAAYPLLAAVAKTELAAILEENYGRKDVAIEACLMRPLDSLGAMAVLKKHNVNKIYLLPGDGSPLQWGACSTCRVYIVRPTVANAFIVTQHWKAQRDTQRPDSQSHDPLAPQHQFTCVFWPRKSHVVDQYFEQHGVFGEIKVAEFNPCFLSLESDLLSMELPEFFADTFLHGTSVHNYAVAKSLWQLQYLYGPITRVYTLGDAAQGVMRLVDRLKQQLGEPRMPTAVGSNADMAPMGELIPPPGYLFVFDRSIDYVSILSTCLTYENLLNETFGISCAVCDFGPEVLDKVNQSDVVKTGKFPLNNKDEIFAHVRDSHVTAVFPYLGEKTKQLQQLAAKAQSVHNTSIAELKQFVSTELKGARALNRNLEVHMSAAEVMQAKWKGLNHRLTNEKCAIDGAYYKEIMSFVEDSLTQPRDNSCHLDLALLCLVSVRLGGLPQKEYLHLRRLFLHAHGFEKLSTWNNLSAMGILYDRSAPTHGDKNPPNVSSICKRLVLVPDADVAQGLDLKNASDMSYVFNAAYTPAACSIVAHCVQNAFDFPAETYSRLFNCAAQSVDTSSRRLAPGHSNTIQAIQSTNRPCVMVLFLGGVTYAEIAALRLLARMRGCKIVIACTNVIGRKQFFEAVAGCRGK